VDQVAVDVEKTGAVCLFVDQMIVPDLVVEGTRCAHGVKSVFLKLLENREMADQAPPAVIRSTKSAVERTGHAGKKPRRQAIMVLQHENMRACASELGFHCLHITIFRGGFNLNHQEAL
jgi:hypothetical protein